jgi:hypothetical protein
VGRGRHAIYRRRVRWNADFEGPSRIVSDFTISTARTTWIATVD